MKKVILVGGLVLAGIVLFLILRDPGNQGPVADATCERAPEYPVVININTAPRQDDIALIDGTGKLHRLTNNHASFDPTFAPGGNRVAYTAGIGSFAECCGFSHQAIAMMDVKDGERVYLSDMDQMDSDPAWRPGDNIIGFSRSGVGLMTASATGGTRIIYREENDPAKQSPRLIQWSRDGKQLAFIAGGSEASIYVMDYRGTKPRLIASDLGDVHDLAWSPDGRTFAFATSEGIFTLI